MRKPTRKTTTPKAPTPRKEGNASYARYWLREILAVDDMDNYASSRQVDPWRGQIMQIGWEYCV